MLKIPYFYKNVNIKTAKTKMNKNAFYSPTLKFTFFGNCLVNTNKQLPNCLLIINKKRTSIMTISIRMFFFSVFIHFLKKYVIIIKKFVRFSFLRSLIGEGGDRVTDFEQLYDTYFNDVYLYILRLSGNEHIAEEITSDTFFKAMKSINSFRGDCDVRVWLCQIAKNTYYSYLKKSEIFPYFPDF